LRTAVVGHVEWVTFACVDHVPGPGEIVHGSDVFDLPAGGGPVAAVQLLKLAGNCTFYTALGDDEFGHRACDELLSYGLRVEAVFRPEPQRRAFVHVDANGERTITVLGSRSGPRGSDPLAWNELDQTGAVYFTAGDDEARRVAPPPEVVRATPAPAGRHLPRGYPVAHGSGLGVLWLVEPWADGERLVRVGVHLDGVVGSGTDPSEVYTPVEPKPELVVTTYGREGGAYTAADGRSGTFAAAPLPGPVADAYGAGDSFAAGLTYELGARMPVEEALAFAARCGAACLTGRGPYEGQLRG
jgi:ribokinase